MHERKTNLSTGQQILRTSLLLTALGLYGCRNTSPDYAGAVDELPTSPTQLENTPRYVHPDIQAYYPEAAAVPGMESFEIITSGGRRVRLHDFTKLKVNESAIQETYEYFEQFSVPTRALLERDDGTVIDLPATIYPDTRSEDVYILSNTDMPEYDPNRVDPNQETRVAVLNIINLTPMDTKNRSYLDDGFSHALLQFVCINALAVSIQDVDGVLYADEKWDFERLFREQSCQSLASVIAYKSVFPNSAYQSYVDYKESRGFPTASQAAYEMVPELPEPVLALPQEIK